MRLLLAAPVLMALVACAGPLAPYEVPVTISNHTSNPIQLVVSNDARTPGEQIGSATPAIVPAFDFAQVTLVVPGSRHWAMFIVPTGSPDVWRALRDEQLHGCRTFTIPIPIEVSLHAGSMHIPDGLC